MKVYSGTSGYSYAEWKGTFYPKDIASADMLAHYAATLRTVEINNTFYRMPKSHVVKGWRDAVGSDFRFSIKATRRITHIKRLNDIDEPLSFLVKSAALLEDKLGAVLFQLPPNFKQNDERLLAFLKQWPKELPAAIEFRNDSWLNDATFDLLAAHNTAIVVSQDTGTTLPERIDTANILYLRLRNPTYTNAELTRWINRARASRCSAVYAYFKHEDAGAGPKLASRFSELASRPAPKRAPRKRTTSKAAK